MTLQKAGQCVVGNRMERVENYLPAAGLPTRPSWEAMLTAQQINCSDFLMPLQSKVEEMSYQYCLDSLAGRRA